MSGRTSAAPRRSPGGWPCSAGGGGGTAAGRAPTRTRSLGDAPVPVLAPQCQRTRLAGEWPLRSFLELGAFPGAVPCARLHVRQLLWEWGITEFSEGVELLVSELLTNAVKASRYLDGISPVRLWLLSDKARVLTLVWDANPRPPVRMSIDEEAEGGRGLVLVETLSQKWDWYAHPELGGKVVWSLVAS